MLTIALCGNRHQDAYLKRIRTLAERLAGAGIRLAARRPFADYLALHGCLPQDTLTLDNPDDIALDAAVSFGGDGTFLRTVRWTERSGVPVLGVNTGHLGFLASLTLEDAERQPEYLGRCLLQGALTTERRMLLTLSAPGIPEDIYPLALNEIAILKADTASMISSRVTIDGHFLADYLADGLVVATPTGSTAYNLSAGGPLVQPQLDCMVLSPLSPHTLTLRPLVVGSGSRLEIVTSGRASDYRVSVDGLSFRLPAGTAIRVGRADFDARVLKMPGENFADTLRNKLHWGAR